MKFITVQQMAEILEDIFVCGWNDKSLKNDYRQYSNALTQLIYNYGRISNNSICSLIVTVEDQYKEQIAQFITVHFSNIDITELNN